MVKIHSMLTTQRSHGIGGVSQAVSTPLPLQTQEVVLVKELKGHTGAVLNVEYISDYNYICTSSTDSSILFFDCNTNYRQKGELFLNYPQLSLAYSSQFHTLFSGGTDGVIHLWNLEEYQQKILLNDQAVNNASKAPPTGHRGGTLTSPNTGTNVGKIKERALLSNGHNDMVMDIQGFLSTVTFLKYESYSQHPPYCEWRDGCKNSYMGYGTIILFH